jgi:hypothetical protein
MSELVVSAAGRGENLPDEEPPMPPPVRRAVMALNLEVVTGARS